MTVRPIVLSGPSGGGKSTILKKVMENHKSYFAFSVSHTTRKPREGEVHGRDYYFVTREEVERMIKNGDFIEHAEFGGNVYGTSKQAVQDVQKSGKICVLDLELQGVRSIKSTDLNAKFILIRAPSIEILKERLIARGSETPESLERRLKHAREDLEAVEKDPKLFHYVIVNDKLDDAYDEFMKLVDDEIQAVKRTQPLLEKTANVIASSFLTVEQQSRTITFPAQEW
uniref:Guanylate kinase n=1 Tax=Panagrolaimus sp. JU765 TaxID=591449 RepID=A0AC34RMR6_9BILA